MFDHDKTVQHDNGGFYDTDGLSAHGGTPPASDCLEPQIISITFYIFMLFICALFVIDILLPDAFSGVATEEETRLFMEHEKATDRELQPLIPRAKGADTEDGAPWPRRQPFLPQAVLHPWSVRYFDPEGREYFTDEIEGI